MGVKAKVFWVTSLVAVVGGCVGLTPVAVNATYNSAEVAWSRGSGTSTIVGEAFARQAGGGVVAAAGEIVILCPDTAFDRAVNIMIANGRQPVRDATYEAYIADCRTTTAGATGNFAFRNIPAGTYSVATQVVWFVSNVPQGGFVFSQVAVTAGQTREVILSR